MKINLKQELRTLDGTRPLRDEKENVVLLRDVLCNTLLATDDSADGKERARRGMLAYKIYGNDELDLDVDDVKLLKDLVGKQYAPLVVFQVWEMLEGREVFKAGNND